MLALAGAALTLLAAAGIVVQSRDRD